MFFSHFSGVLFLTIQEFDNAYLKFEKVMQNTNRRNIM